MGYIRCALLRALTKGPHTYPESLEGSRLLSEGIILDWCWRGDLGLTGCRVSGVQGFGFRV